MLSALTVVLLYTLIQVTAQGVLGETLPNFKDAPLAEVGKTMIGPLGATLVIVGACFSMFGNLSGFALNMPRIIFAAARDEERLRYKLSLWDGSDPCCGASSGCERDLDRGLQHRPGL